MKVYFENKKQSKQRQLQEFLSLSPYERFLKFLRTSREMAKLLPQKYKKEKKDNFYIR